MWQSIKMSGTFFLTCSKMGAPMVILGTKWPSMTSETSAVVQVYDLCHHVNTGKLGRARAITPVRGNWGKARVRAAGVEIAQAPTGVLILIFMCQSAA